MGFRRRGCGAAAMKRRALLIAGPTASGKSAVALALAQRCGATIVNADSMQVYRDLRVLTARPSRERREQAPHELVRLRRRRGEFFCRALARAGARAIAGDIFAQERRR